ncbi:hypothetical protein KY290_000148 [Solanum tuberosum]|uniref:Uncharacterized protein n=1 Tax=Solanum tuberosum TaxID=4113 RepID=A0ABQ7WIH6_SOLTU|nr:hypothetical protein KY290_000148 [Solanum tuberosum]
MLKPQIQQSSQSTKTLIPYWNTKPLFLASFPINILNNKNLRVNKKKKNFITKVVVSSTENSTYVQSSNIEKSTSGKALVIVQRTVGGTNFSFTRGLDDIGDLFGRSLLLSIVAAELDPSKYS